MRAREEARVRVQLLGSQVENCSKFLSVNESCSTARQSADAQSTEQRTSSGAILRLCQGTSIALIVRPLHGTKSYYMHLRHMTYTQRMHTLHPTNPTLTKIHSICRLTITFRLSISVLVEGGEYPGERAAARPK